MTPPTLLLLSLQSVVEAREFIRDVSSESDGEEGEKKRAKIKEEDKEKLTHLQEK